MLECPERKTKINLPPCLDRNYFGRCNNCHQWVYFDNKSQNLLITENIPSKSTPLTFFSHSFREEDKQINNLFVDLLLFLYIPVCSVEYDLRPKDKVEKARNLIKASNMVFVVMPRRYRCFDGKNKAFWKTSDWLQNEIGMACAFGRDIVAIIEENVRDNGMLKDVRYCYKFNRENLFLPWIEDKPNRSDEEAKMHLIHVLEYIHSWRKQHQ